MTTISVVPAAAYMKERTYVWAPGDPAYHGGARRYDWKVVERLAVVDGAFVGTGRTLCVDDKDLSPIA